MSTTYSLPGDVRPSLKAVGAKFDIQILILILKLEDNFLRTRPGKNWKCRKIPVLAKFKIKTITFNIH